MIGARAKITNKSMSSSSTEVSFEIPTAATRFEIKLRSRNALLQIAFVSGESGSNYITIPYGASYAENNIKGGLTIYFQSPTGSQTAEIKHWV